MSAGSSHSVPATGKTYKVTIQYKVQERRPSMSGASIRWVDVCGRDAKRFNSTDAAREYAAQLDQDGQFDAGRFRIVPVAS